MAGSPMTPEERKERKRERRLARRTREGSTAPARVSMSKEKVTELAAKNRQNTSPIVEKYFRFESSHGQPKIFCKICGKSFTWNDQGRSLGISVSFAVKHMIAKHGATPVYPADLKDWIMRKVKK